MFEIYEEMAKTALTGEAVSRERARWIRTERASEPSHGNEKKHTAKRKSEARRKKS